MGTPMNTTITSLDPSYHNATCPECLQFSRLYQLPNHNCIERRLYTTDHRNLGVFLIGADEKFPDFIFFSLERQS